MGMDCREFFGYVFYCLPTFEMDLLPAEAQDHLEVCSKCRARLAQLRVAFKLLRKREKKLARQAKKSLARVLARVKHRIKRGDLDDLPEVPDVDCRMVQPFLALAADPLGEIFPSGWMEEHLALCEDCAREYRLLGELRDTVTMAEILTSTKDIAIDDIFPEAKPSAARRVLRLVNIKPSDIICEQARPHYHSMATCTFEPPVPGEIYLHSRCCTFCEEQVKQLRSKLRVAIPQPGSPEFDDLLAGKR